MRLPYQSNGLNASVSCGEGLENKGNWYYIDTLPNQRIDSTCDYLLIIHDSLYFKEAGQKAIDSLAAYRAYFNGFDVAIVTMGVIERDIINASNNKFRIRKLIDSTYHFENALHTYDGK